MSERQAQHVERYNSRPDSYPTVNSLSSDVCVAYSRPRHNQGRRSLVNNQTNRPCGLCRGQYPHWNNRCPAEGARCCLCNRLNHFASVCRSAIERRQSVTSSHNRRQNVIREDNNRVDYVSPDAPYEYTNEFGVNSVIGVRRDRPYITVFVNNTPLRMLRMLVDSGSSANIIDHRTLSQIILSPRLQPTGDVRMFG